MKNGLSNGGATKRDVNHQMHQKSSPNTTNGANLQRTVDKKRDSQHPRADEATASMSTENGSEQP